ncbi:hypothetical protein [Geochorda subterranea]|uniref:Uncharacterized protein n=1 Tax=Geochorda subterranea TaxID=3109564 RepID=A0ABZ1BMH2_9FIRM|nr:hypothetical protein [Limnochorda sp. LNt]WRP14020.1 hypothetical protein VLY81_11390 [Limnochorda sp. LNt]
MAEPRGPVGPEPTVEELQHLERVVAAGGPDAERARATLAEMVAASASWPKPQAKELRRVLLRLRSRGIAVEPPSGAGPSPAGRARPGRDGVTATPLRSALSPIEGPGVARLEMVWELRQETWRLHATVSDGRGLEELEAARVARRQASQEMEHLADAELQAVEPEWGARMLAGAVALARQRGVGLPREYVVLRPELEPALPEADGGPYGWARACWSPGLLEALGGDAQRVEWWARGSASLLETGEVRWDLREELGPLLEEARRQSSIRLVLLPATQHALVERIALRMSEALHEGAMRRRLAERLAYVALRLDRAGRLTMARLAAAASMVLADPQATGRVGVVEALVGVHLAPYLPRREPSPSPGRPGVAREPRVGPARPPVWP